MIFHPFKAIIRTFKATPSAFLLAIQVLIILAYPYLRNSLLGNIFLAISTIAMLGTILLVVKHTPALFWVSVLFGVPSIAFSVAEAFIPGNSILLAATAISHICFYFYASYALIRYVFADSIVTRDEWFATAAAFTVILWAFAYVFLLVDVLVPDSFTLFEERQNSFFEALFLSFSVLTGVGLSDIIPATDQGRAVLMIADVVGLFYMALIVSRLVTMSSAKQGTKLIERVMQHTTPIDKEKKDDDEL